MNSRLGAAVLRTWRLRALYVDQYVDASLAALHGSRRGPQPPRHSGGRLLLAFLVAAAEAALQGTAGPSLLSALQRG
jgi:hypothetical protein